LLAARPKTLPAAVAPVCVGTSLAASHQHLALMPAIAALAGALLLQIGVNLANDYFDHVRSIDTADRLGPVRVTQSGLISPERIRTVMWALFGSAAAVGGYLIKIGGWPIAVIGLASILSALAYSGGPYPLASHGLGDLFVFIFFGPVAVCGTYYIQALEFSSEIFWTSVPVGLLITAILVVNNLRDIKTDQRAGKRTLAVMIGPARSRIEYVILLAGSYTLICATWAGSGMLSRLLPLVSLPAAGVLVRSIYRAEGRELNRLLARTAMLALGFSLLLSLGLLL